MCRKAGRARLVERILELEQKVFKALHPLMPQEWFNVNLTMPQLRALLVLFADGPTSMSAGRGYRSPLGSPACRRLLSRDGLSRQKPQAGHGSGHEPPWSQGAESAQRGQTL